MKTHLRTSAKTLGMIIVAAGLAAYTLPSSAAWAGTSGVHRSTDRANQVATTGIIDGRAALAVRTSRPFSISEAPPDGAALYGQYCTSCHGQAKKGKTAAAIQGAIDHDMGKMGTLKFLTPAQIAAISAAH